MINFECSDTTETSPFLAEKWQKLAKSRYFGSIVTSGNAIGVILIQQLDDVVFYQLCNPNHVIFTQIWHKSPKPRQIWVAAGRNSQSRQFLDSSLTGFRYLMKL